MLLRVASPMFSMRVYNNIFIIQDYQFIDSKPHPWTWTWDIKKGQNLVI
jgi:hypothetical protein